jgi:hypothetical protein
VAVKGFDGTQIVALVVACVVAAVVGGAGLVTTVRYVRCHQQIDSLGLGLTPAYDPLTGVCTIRL